MFGPAGVTIGHSTDDPNQTGCSVILFDRSVPCVVDVRGGAPGTRETDLLQPGRLVQQVDAIVLSGGSAFGLATADGVMRYLREQRRGFPTAAGPVPIVPAAVLYDLAVGNPVPPTQEMGYVACVEAVPIERAHWGAVGAGRGATTDKITGVPLPGGIGYGTVAFAKGNITAIAAVNALGVAVGKGDHQEWQRRFLDHPVKAPVGENTTLVVVLVDAAIDHDGLRQIAVSAHDGMARAINPCHTPFDGDLVFVAALRDTHGARVHDATSCVATEMAVESAIRHAITTARSSPL
jgi:L-aminopeptidase/D-esterase-like protein